MVYVYIILALLMLVRCAVPLKGFFLDDTGRTEEITGKGMQSQIVLHETRELIRHESAPEEELQVEEDFVDDGVELSDLTNSKQKINRAVDVDTMYANIDSSDESLTDTVKKALNK